MEDSSKEKREKRAKSIAAMGLVQRFGAKFKVSTPSLRGKQAFYEVWRNEAGKVICNCLEFEEETAKSDLFRCEHILAVKYALVAKNNIPAVQEVEQQKATDTAKDALNEANKTLDGLTIAVDPGNAGGDFTSCNFVLPNGADYLLFVHARKIEGENKARFQFDYNPKFFKGFAAPGDLKLFMMNMFQAYLKFEAEVWKVHGDGSERAETIPDEGSFPGNPIARNLDDLVTAKQLGMIRAISRDIGIDPDEECTATMKCKTDELSKRAASALIEHLQNLQKQELGNG